MASIAEYSQFVGHDTVDELRRLSQKLAGKKILQVNSTAVGGGVAEILNCMVPLLNELGLETRWEVIKGGEAFFAVTKKIHNALHGQKEEWTDQDWEVFESAQEKNAEQFSCDEDIVFIHDPQPVGLIRKRKGLDNRWIWRCHVDISAPDPKVWNYLKHSIELYDCSVFSAPIFSQTLSIPQALICPSIDPLSEKNRKLDPEEINKVIEKLGIPLDKPLVTQVSRFDRLKDPIGVVRAFRRIQKYVDARLLLVGGSAADDPEGVEVYEEVKAEVNNDPDILVLLLPPTSHKEINAIQSVSTIILQKSLREGFGLTITEALWKGKPVVASAVGGIPLQITHKYSGLLTHSIEGTAHALKQLLQEPAYAKKLGENGREHVRQNFLLTRHIRDYLLLFLSSFYPDKNHIDFSS